MEPKIIANGQLQLVLGTTGPTDKPEFFLAAVELLTPAGWRRILVGVPGSESGAKYLVLTTQHVDGLPDCPPPRRIRHAPSFFRVRFSEPPRVMEPATDGSWLESPY